MQRGDIGFIRGWLHDRIWSKGCELESQELMVKATGAGSSAAALMTHLEDRYLHGEY